MITVTSLSNAKTLANIRAAYAQSKATGLPVYVKNRKGAVSFRVRCVAGKLEVYRGNQDLSKTFWDASSRFLLASAAARKAARLAK